MRSQDDRQGKPRLQGEALSSLHGSSLARTCAALAGSAAWWDDGVLAYVGASGLLAFLCLQGESQLVGRFATGNMAHRLLQCTFWQHCVSGRAHGTLVIGMV